MELEWVRYLRTVTGALTPTPPLPLANLTHSNTLTVTSGAGVASENTQAGGEYTNKNKQRKG